MNKKLMAVAVAGALGAPALALAQASTVQIYGTIVINYNYLDQGNHRVKTDLWNSHDANLGFKGEEQLGGGLSTWFQCESTMDVTGQSASEGGASWCGRNSAVGFKGGFGNIYAGVWDTSMKIAMANFRPFSTSGAYGMGALLWNGAASDVGNGQSGGNGTSFTRRQTNTLNYQTPNWAGFQAGAQFSSADEATNTTPAASASKPRLWSLGATYTNGPLILGGGYERHHNYNPGNIGNYFGGSDKAWNLGAAYTFGGVFKLSAIYSDMKYEIGGNTAATAGDLKQKSWGVFGDWAISGPHRLRLEYVEARDTKGTAVVNVGSFIANAGAGNTGGKLYGIQYAYAFSKRTEVNFGYARVNNDSNAKYALQTLGTGTLGQDQDAIVLGIKHSF
jgi:predicted porin